MDQAAATAPFAQPAPSEPAAVDYGRAVHQSFPVFKTSFDEVMASKEDAATLLPRGVGSDADDVLNLVMILQRGDGKRVQLSVPVKQNQPPVEKDGKLTSFGLMRIGPCTWAVVPSVNAEGVYHGHVVLRDVPEAPTEPKSKLILPYE